MSSREAIKHLRMFLEMVKRGGKMSFGLRTSMKYAKSAKLVIVSNCVSEEEIEKLKAVASRSRTPVIFYNITSAELGKVAGRPHPVKALAVNTLGDADLNKLVEVARQTEESGATRILVAPRRR